MRCDTTSRTGSRQERNSADTVTAGAMSRSAQIIEAIMEPWRTGLVHARDGQIWIRGHNVASLMRTATFTDTIFLLHRGRLPDSHERRILDAILTSSADHG